VRSSISQFQIAGGPLKAATGTNERNGPERLKSRAHLRLTPKLEQPRKTYTIGVCESVFTRRTEVTKADPETKMILDAPCARSGHERFFSPQTETLIVCAASGLLLGYLFGKLSR
jgi:hypothetical protein